MIGSALTVRECVLISRMIDALRVENPTDDVSYSIRYTAEGVKHWLQVIDPVAVGVKTLYSGQTVEALYENAGRPGDLSKEYEGYYAGKPFPVKEGE
jgi:hypothetical protein